MWVGHRYFVIIQ